MGAGIDYGLGKTNIDNETGIRYGVIHSRHVFEMWNEGAQPIINTNCPHCGNELTQEMYEEANTYCSKEGDPEDLKLRTCPSCEEVLCDLDFQDSEPLGFIINDNKYLAQQDSNDDCADIFIIKSPYYTKCDYCSPCAPGAGYILNQNEEGCKAYCLGPEFFDEDDENIPVLYRVADDTVVLPKYKWEFKFSTSYGLVVEASAKTGTLNITKPKINGKDFPDSIDSGILSLCSLLTIANSVITKYEKGKGTPEDEALIQNIINMANELMFGNE